jgi:hypothetical protein
MIVYSKSSAPTHEHINTQKQIKTKIKHEKQKQPKKKKKNREDETSEQNTTNEGLIHPGFLSPAFTHDVSATIGFIPAITATIESFYSAISATIKKKKKKTFFQTKTNANRVVNPKLLVHGLRPTISTRTIPLF